MKKLLTTLILITGFSTFACTGGNRPITKEQLPEAAQQFILQHFQHAHIAHIAEDTDMMSKSYELFFANGDKIEFAKDGTWTDVDCKYSSVPSLIIPLPIKEYVEKSCPATLVKKIERGKNGYEVKLDNSLELKFNKKMQISKVDD